MRIRVAVGILVAASVAVLGTGTRADAAAAPRLEARLAGAPAVVAGHVSRVEPYDHDRVRVIHFTVDRIVKGEGRLAGTGGTLEVVEMRDRPSAPPLLSAGDYAVAFLRRTRGGSYLEATLGPGRRWQATAGRYGVIADRDASVVGEVAALTGRLADQSRAPAETARERELARRAWIFDALSARHPDLVEEGAAALGEIPGLSGSLDEAERARLESALRRDDLPPRVRAEVIDAIGDASLSALAPAVAAVRGDTPAVLEASWRVQAELGSAPGAAVFERRLRDAHPEVRAAAVRGYVAYRPEAAVPRMADFFAGELDPDVRIAVLEALGPKKADDATELLETAFAEDGDLAVRQAAGRVIFERGGGWAADSLARLAFSAPPAGQRHAVALLEALGLPKDDPRIARIRETHPDPKVREIALHGFAGPHH